MGAANNINATYAPVLRTGGAAGTAWHQTDTGLLWVPPSIIVGGVPSSVGASSRATWREGIWIRRFELHNRSGGTASVGIGGRLANRHWIAGRYDGTTYTDFTSTAQSQSTSTLQVTGADQTGFVILSRVKFDWVSVNITTAETDAGGATVPDHAVQYSTAGGNWTAVGANAALTDGFTQTNAVWAAAVTNFAWLSAADWAVTDSHTGVAAGYYGIYFTSAQREATDVAAIATGMEIGKALCVEGVADNGVWEMEEVDYWIPEADGLVAYFSTANAGNRVYTEVLTR